MSYLRNNKILLLIIAALLLANIASLYFGVWNRGHRFQGKGHKGGKEMREQIRLQLEKEVGLNKEQLAIYDTLRANHFESIRPMFEELRMAKDSLFRLMNRPQSTDSVISLQSDMVSSKQKAIDLKFFQYFRSVRNICTEEQKPKMDSFLLQLTKRMSESRRRGPGPGRDNK